MDNNQSSNSGVDVRVNTKVNFYGPVVMIGSISVATVGFLFLGIFMHTYWSQAVTLATVIVYGLVTLFFLAILGAIVALWIHFVVKPMRNKVLHKQENAIVFINERGLIEVYPLVPGLYDDVEVVESGSSPAPFAIASPVEDDKTVNEGAVIEMYKLGLHQATIAERVGCSQSKVSRVLNKHKKEIG